MSVSPLAWALAYQYPVQQISPNFLPSEVPEKPTYLIVYRDKEDEVNFIQTTPITFRLLQLLEENTLTIEAVLQKIMSEVTLLDPESFTENGLNIINNLIKKEILIIT